MLASAAGFGLAQAIPYRDWAAPGTIGGEMIGETEG